MYTCNTYATNIDCFVLLQKKVIRLLCGAKRLDHTSRLFYNLRILKVPDIVGLRIGIITLKAYHNLLATYVQQFFSQHEYVYVLRHNYTFIHNFARTNANDEFINYGIILIVKKMLSGYSSFQNKL